MEMMNLWDLLVENIFGGFWIAVFGMAMIFFIILAMGSLSGYTILLFLAIFILAMAYGYGYPIIMVLVFIFAAYYMISQWQGWIERSGGN